MESLAFVKLTQFNVIRYGARMKRPSLSAYERKVTNFMPTIFTHPAIPLALGLGLVLKVVPQRLIAAGIVVSILPD
jgi:hypothetical protein